MSKDVAGKAKNIKLFIMDVDGILTDGSINIEHEGGETKRFDVQDGFGIVILRKSGLKTAIVSARTAKAVITRATDLKIDRIFQDAYPKMDAYNQLKKEFKYKDDEVCFMGDDLPDLAVLKKAGLAVTVPNAVDEVKKAADYITKKPGGHGAVREVIELILKAQGKWSKIVEEFSK